MGSFDSAKPKVGKDSVRLENLVELLKLKPNKWVTIRILPNDIFPIKEHWIDIVTKSKKEVRIPKICVSFDPAKEADKDGVNCPYCTVNNGGISYLVNVIHRGLQEDEPKKKGKPTKTEAKTGFKVKDSETWTPVVVARFPSSLVKKIQSLKDLNKVKKDGKTTTYGASHAKYGFDIDIKYDPDASGTDKYQVQKGERSSITDEEKEYLVYDLNESLLDALGRETPKEAKKELGRMELKGSEEVDGSDEEEDDDDDLDYKKKKKKKKSEEDDDDFSSKKKGKKKSKDDEEEEEDEEEEDEEEEDEEEEDEPKSKKSKSKKKKPVKGKKKSKDEEEEEEDEEEEEEEDEDEEEEDEEEEEEEDEEEEDEEEDEDEDEPKSKKKKPVKSKSSKKKGKKSKDEDDSDDEEEEEEEDDDEPKSKKSKSKKKKSKDDEDDEIPF